MDGTLAVFVVVVVVVLPKAAGPLTRDFHQAIFIMDGTLVLLQRRGRVFFVTRCCRILQILNHNCRYLTAFYVTLRKSECLTTSLGLTTLFASTDAYHALAKQHHNLMLFYTWASPP